jgi:hypothetical protein
MLLFEVTATERASLFLHTLGGRHWLTVAELRLPGVQVTRDKSTNLVRGAMNITSALIFGSIFWRLGFKQSTIQDRMGLLQVRSETPSQTHEVARRLHPSVTPKSSSNIRRTGRLLSTAGSLQALSRWEILAASLETAFLLLLSWERRRRLLWRATTDRLFFPSGRCCQHRHGFLDKDHQ